MNKSQPLHVAAPWALSHYIPLNGYHPLYRALFDEAPEEIELHAWDNVKLYEHFSRNIKLREDLISIAKEQEKKLSKADGEGLSKNWHEYFWAPNQILTAALKGDIEFHHTAPYPSFERPFVFHCESFAPIFIPFAEQGSGEFKNKEVLKAHYGNIFSHPMCLGIFSHIPETLKSISLFFSNPEIDRKLFSSKIGLSAKALVDSPPSQDISLARAKFLFINSANQNPANFFKRGGHIVLRFWKNLQENDRNALLMLRCARPSKADLIANGVDIDFLESETNRSIIWIEEYLANHEQNALMASANFLLLPSASLHSVSIMQSMLLGAIPVVTDTIGTDRYVSDGENGIVLEGMRDANWYVDPGTEIWMDRYNHNPVLDEALVQQLTVRVASLLDNPGSYVELRDRVLAHAKSEFSGENFSHEFWNKVISICADSALGTVKETTQLNEISQSLQVCTLQPDDLARVFESATQPMRRIYTGGSVVWELGGAMIHTYGNPGMNLTDWSPLAQYYKPLGIETTFANTLPELGGKYLSYSEKARRGVGKKITGLVSRMLMPFPALHSFAAFTLKRIRRYRRYVDFKILKSNIEPDIELALNGVYGYNVIRYFHKYYAIPQNEGQFLVDKVKAGGYSSCFSGNSVEAIIRQIPVIVDEVVVDASRHGAEPPLSLVLEGFHGFNVIRRGAEYHAILQSEGAFVYSKIVENGYSKSYSGASLSKVQQEILLSIESEKNVDAPVAPQTLV